MHLQWVTSPCKDHGINEYMVYVMRLLLCTGSGDCTSCSSYSRCTGCSGCTGCCGCTLQCETFNQNPCVWYMTSDWVLLFTRGHTHTRYTHTHHKELSISMVTSHHQSNHTTPLAGTEDYESGATCTL